jgi:hypothetical protein
MGSVMKQFMYYKLGYKKGWSECEITQSYQQDLKDIAFKKQPLIKRLFIAIYKELKR